MSDERIGEFEAHIEVLLGHDLQRPKNLRFLGEKLPPKEPVAMH